MAAGDRSKKIYGRIKRILENNYYYPADKINESEIYDEIQQSQIQIFSLVQPEKIFTVALMNNEDVYPLSQENTNREIIKKIKSVITPVAWTLPFIFVSNASWDELIKTEDSNSDGSQPRIGTIIAHSLYVFPKPNITYSGKELQFICILKCPETSISTSVDPELNEVYDKDLEWFTLFSITNDPKWFQFYESSINTKFSLGSEFADENTVKDTEW